MTYLIKNLGWKNREIFLMMLAHLALLIWSIFLIFSTKTLAPVSLILNYILIFFFGLILVRYNQKISLKYNELAK